ncbi:MAG TPA: TolC family protein [Bacteroidales bacterium]|nr:MAG: outer membrane channel protein [Bacteroidetes bacterium ADurb.Bin139]HOG25953.1 TolC family protein [Bacteroidales bacterium]HOR11813.1 TolC family protein [Bacteroidales bacterium]HOZ19474.1 TolC family protein [Bacteroidales bacterium]HPK39178.1 TolC family protein [Bacteroidales bacterium]
MKKSACILVVLLSFVQVQLLRAQDTLYVDLETALKIALSESPVIRIADREVVRALYARKETQSGLWPKISASGVYNRTLKKQVMVFDFGGTPTEISVGTDNNWMGGVTLSLPLVAPALWKTVQLSALDIDLAVEKARSGRLAMVSAVKQAYYSLLLAKDSYVVLKKNYDNVALNTKTVTDKYAQGMASEFEKLRAEVALKNQRPNLLASETAIELAAMQLKALMGLDIEYPVVFAGSLIQYEGEVTTVGLSSTNGFSLEKNTDLMQLDIQKQQMELAMKIAKASFLPTLSLSSNYQYSSMNNDFRFSNYNWYPYSTASLALSIPLFNGLKRQQQIRQSKLSLETLDDSRVNSERTLRLNVSNCLNQMSNAVESLSSNKENVSMAEKAYSISCKQYEVGMGTWLDLSASELALTQARLAYHQSVYNYLFYRAELEKITGTSNYQNQ